MSLGFVSWVGNCCLCGLVKLTETLYVIMSYTNKHDIVGKMIQTGLQCWACIISNEEVTSVTAYLSLTHLET